MGFFFVLFCFVFFFCGYVILKIWGNFPNKKKAKLVDFTLKEQNLPNSSKFVRGKNNQICLLKFFYSWQMPVTLT